jgi:ornithine--oxo-acid transaminase
MPDADSRVPAEELIAIEDRFGAHNYRPLDVVIERSSGVWVYDVNGRRYLDCLSAYSALNQGHCLSSPPNWLNCAAWKWSCR